LKTKSHERRRAARKASLARFFIGVKAMEQKEKMKANRHEDEALDNAGYENRRGLNGRGRDTF
jgi:hypothetical protein